ncbi:uncharacterized protein LOC116860961 isoform X1 [Lontra canadensis]|uniref:uncharacterized protein LOC116860961 isoform X1 n=1 Tax=Lontra canadensis TaxID=76717 RepID=UPI0013F382E7|nr:uncharacterized protein LOC116860961 isoform X1 [Lontra canadensis]
MVATILIQHIIPRFGLPQTLQSDNGPAFISSVTQQDQRTQGSDPSTAARHVLLGPGPLHLGNLATPSGGTCMHNPPSSLSCSLSFPILAGSPTRTCPSVRQSTPPPALLSPAHFRLPL